MLNPEPFRAGRYNKPYTPRRRAWEVRLWIEGLVAFALLFVFACTL